MSQKISRLMIVGATWEQVPLIKAAKALGHWVVATDPNPESEGLRFADAREIVDPLDLSTIVDLATRYKVDGMTADECDYSHYAATFVSSRMGLPNDGLSASQYTTNKRNMRDRCREARVLQPRYFSCRTYEEVKKAAQVIDWPVVIKPVDNRGSIGVSVVRSDANLLDAFLDAVMNAHSREVLVEAYVEGTHITVDGCVDQNGKHHNLGIASKKVTPGDKPIIVEVIYPAEIPDEQIEVVLRTNDEVVAALGINSGLTHSEYIIDAKNRTFLVETANRGGGVLTSAIIIPKVCGVDLSALLIANALGQPFAVEPQALNGMVMLSFLVFESGTVKEIHGLDEARSVSNVMELRLNFNPGDELVPAVSGAARHGFVIIEGASRADLQVTYDKAMKMIQLEIA
jgi:biotin carboxylase